MHFYQHKLSYHFHHKFTGVDGTFEKLQNGLRILITNYTEKVEKKELYTEVTQLVGNMKERQKTIEAGNEEDNSENILIVKKSKGVYSKLVQYAVGIDAGIKARLTQVFVEETETLIKDNASNTQIYTWQKRQVKTLVDIKIGLSCE